MAALNVATLCRSEPRSRGSQAWSAWRHWRPRAQALKAAVRQAEGEGFAWVAWRLRVGLKNRSYKSIESLAIEGVYCIISLHDLYVYINYKL